MEETRARRKGSVEGVEFRDEGEVDEEGDRDLLRLLLRERERRRADVRGGANEEGECDSLLLDTLDRLNLLVDGFSGIGAGDVSRSI